VTIIVTVVLTGIILHYSKTLLHHFGVSYVQASPVLNILIIGFMFGACAQPAKNILAYSGHEISLLYISVFELSFMILLCSISTYLFDIKGLACATAFIIITRTLLFHIAVYRKLKFKAFVI